MREPAGNVLAQDCDLIYKTGVPRTPSAVRYTLLTNWDQEGPASKSIVLRVQLVAVLIALPSSENEPEAFRDGQLLAVHDPFTSFPAAVATFRDMTDRTGRTLLGPLETDIF